MGKVTSTVYALSGFYYTFALFQIPIGILIDRYGSRLLPSIGILLCAVGAIVMSRAESNFEILISRGIIGVGATFSFLNGLKIINNWFQPKRFSYLLGLFIAIGSPAVLIFKAGFNQLEKTVQWHGAMMTFGLAGLIFACIFSLLFKTLQVLSFLFMPTLPIKRNSGKIFATFLILLMFGS